MTGRAEDLATLRLCLTPGVYKVPKESLAALDRVEAELAALEARATQAEDALISSGIAYRDEQERANDAEAEAARLREERDARQRELDDLRDEFMADAGLRTAAEARCARLQQALAEIRDGYDGDEFADSADTVDDHREIARQALSGFPESPGHPMRVRLQRALAEAVLSIEEYAEASGTLIADTSKLRALAGPDTPAEEEA